MGKKDQRYRKDDAFGRKLIASLVIALIVALIGWVFSAGEKNKQITVNKDDIAKNAQKIDALAVAFNEGNKNANQKLIRLEVMMETIITSTGKINEGQAVIYSEQQRRGPEIEQALMHVRDNHKHK